MTKFILKRLAMMIFVLLGISVLVFVILHFAPGDPAVIICGDFAEETVLEETREKLGLNKPLFVQWFDYVKNIVLYGDFGLSWSTGKSVTISIFERFPTTVMVAVLGALCTAIIGIVTGIVSAIKQYTWMDNLATFVGMIGVSMPNFFTGLVLVMVFSLYLKVLPASGNATWLHYVLPIVTISFSSCASQMRMTRSSMLEVMRQDYIRTARAKGQSERKIIMHHELRNALIPIITVTGQQLGILLGGSMIVEQIFSLPGVGKLMMDSINYRDYPMVRGCILLLGLCMSLVNLMVDISYAIADPRIRSQFAGSKKSKKRGEQQ